MVGSECPKSINGVLTNLSHTTSLGMYLCVFKGKKEVNMTSYHLKLLPDVLCLESSPTIKKKLLNLIKSLLCLILYSAESLSNKDCICERVVC